MGTFILLQEAAFLFLRELGEGDNNVMTKTAQWGEKLYFQNFQAVKR